MFQLCIFVFQLCIFMFKSMCKIIECIQLIFYILWNKNINISYYYKFNKYLGPETLQKEYKLFTFNLIGLPYNDNELDNLCMTNKFVYNNLVISNIYKYITTFIVKNICAFLNSNISGTIYIGVNNNGYIKGIPFLGILQITKLYFIIYIIIFWNIHTDMIFNYSYLYFNIRIIKVIKPKLSSELYHPEYISYLNYKQIYITNLKLYNNELNILNIRLKSVATKLLTLINDNNSRQEIIKFIKLHNINNINNINNTNNTNNTNKVLSRLESNEYFEVLENVNTIKTDVNNPFYWVTKWKDITCMKIQYDIYKFKTSFSKRLLKPNNISYTLISGIEKMIPFWAKYNSKLKLYIIEITIYKNNKSTKYYTNNKLFYRRISHTGEPQTVTHL